MVGSGKRLFREGSEKKVLRLVETKMLSSGVMVLTYHPDKSSPGPNRVGLLDGHASCSPGHSSLERRGGHSMNTHLFATLSSLYPAATVLLELAQEIQLRGRQGI
jgi:hypothetical protein